MKREKQLSPLILDREHPCVGKTVRSVAGHDAKRYFVIIGAGTHQPERSDNASAIVYIADGKLRKTEKPKCKKMRHLKIVGQAGCELKQRIINETLTNKLLWNYIKTYYQDIKDDTTMRVKEEQHAKG